MDWVATTADLNETLDGLTTSIRVLREAPAKLTERTKELVSQPDDEGQGAELARLAPWGSRQHEAMAAAAVLCDPTAACKRQHPPHRRLLIAAVPWLQSWMPTPLRSPPRTRSTPGAG
jgi:hypothetical protein